MFSGCNRHRRGGRAVQGVQSLSCVVPYSLVHESQSSVTSERRRADGVTDLPRGTVTFLFTDIEGSTRLWERDPERMPAAFRRHETLLRQAIAAHGGYTYKMIGDAFQAAFQSAENALAASITAQRGLAAEA